MTTLDRYAEPLAPSKRSGLPSGYVCTCGERQPFSPWAIVQTSQGGTLTHTCKCGRRNTVQPDRTVILDPGKG